MTVPTSELSVAILVVSAWTVMVCSALPTLSVMFTAVVVLICTPTPVWVVELKPGFVTVTS
jgi:hypothetical protein